MEELGRIEKILTLFTALFFLLGLSIFIYGIYFYVQSDNLFDTTSEENIIEKVFKMKMLEDISQAANTSASGLDDENLLDLFKIKGYYTASGFTCVMIGVLICALCIAGFKLIVSMESMQVFTYINFVLLFLAILDTVFTGKDDYITRKMKNSLKDYNGDVDPSEWNKLMYGMKCCGSHNFKDFKYPDKWPRNIDGYDISGLEKTLKSPNHYDNYILPRDCFFKNNSKVIFCSWMYSKSFITPIACCKNVKDVFNGCHLKDLANESNNNMNTGCAQRVLKQLSGFFESSTYAVLYGWLLVALIIYCLLLCALLLKDSTVSDEDEFVSNYDFTRTPSFHTGLFRLANEVISESYQKWIPKDELMKKRHGKTFADKKTQTSDRIQAPVWTPSRARKTFGRILSITSQKLFQDNDSMTESLSDTIK